MEEKQKGGKECGSRNLKRVMNESRAERIMANLCDSEESRDFQNPILVMINDWYDEYERNPRSGDYIEFQMFEREVGFFSYHLI